MGGNGRRRETSDNKPCRSRITQFSFLLPLLLPRLITVTFVCDKIFHKSKYPIVLIISSNFRENVKRNYMFLSICRISFRNFVFFSLSLYYRKHRVDDKTVEEEMGLGKKSGFRRPVQVILQFYRLVLSGQLLRHKK